MAWCAYEFPHAWILGAGLLAVSVASLGLGGFAALRGLRYRPGALRALIAAVWAVTSLVCGQWMLGWLMFGDELHAVCHRDWPTDCASRRFERLCRTVHDCPMPVPTEPGLAGVDTPRCTAEERAVPGSVYCGVGPVWLDLKRVSDFPFDGGMTVHACRLDTH
jgi:hypothetical protein